MATPNLKELSPRLQDRYGVRKTSRLVVALGVLAAAFVMVTGGWVAYSVATPESSHKLLLWSVPADDHVSATFEVRRSDGAALDCALRAQDVNRHDVGYSVVEIPPGNTYDQITYQLATRDRADSVDVLGCARPGELNVQAADFPPGTSNPPQPWSP